MLIIAFFMSRISVVERISLAISPLLLPLPTTFRTALQLHGGLLVKTPTRTKGRKKSF